MRVNARFDDESQKQIEYLVEATGTSVSHVVREAVAQYYVQVRGRRGMPRFLALIGTGDSGRTDIASNVKKYVLEGLEEKHGLTPIKPE